MPQILVLTPSPPKSNIKGASKTKSHSVQLKQSTMKYTEYFWELKIDGLGSYKSEYKENTIFDIYEELLNLIFRQDIYMLFYNEDGIDRLDAPIYILNVWCSRGERIPMSINLSFRDTEEYFFSPGEICDHLKMNDEIMSSLERRRSWYYNNVLPNKFQDVPWWRQN